MSTLAYCFKKYDNVLSNFDVEQIKIYTIDYRKEGVSDSRSKYECSSRLYR